MLRFAFAVCTVLLSAAACKVAIAAQPSCPPPGTVAIRDDGTRLEFLGEDNSEAGLCLVRRGEQEVKLLFGLWAPPGPEIGQARAALASLLAGAPGTQVSISEHVATDTWYETWRRGPEEEIALTGGRRRAIRLERTMRMSGPVPLAAEVVYWVDAETGVVLKATHRHLAGLRLPYRDVVITRLDRRG
ncbi:MAG: hypothetical protein NZ523_02250 [Elioraea sp.]|nr:hypothetical protein [Elioraea sp.]MDW8444191.1 hypothetical protein [Acetobacteraceae bacterium]